MNHLKIFGIERSGTNYLQALLKLNTDVKVFSNCYGWKHGWIKKDESDCSKKYRGLPELDFIIIIKNPYSWYFSIERWAKNFDFDTFFNKYDQLYRHYWKFNGNHFWKKKYIVKYEDLIKEPFNEVDKICQIYGIDRIKGFKNPKKVKESYYEFNQKMKNYYLGDDFGLSKDRIKKINNKIGDDIFKNYKYKRL